MFFRKQNTPTKNDGQELINKSNQQGDTVGDGTSNRVLVGYQQDGFGTGKDFGIKVSQDGKDVKTATDDELVMSSAFNMFKVVASGTTSLDANATAGNPIVTTVNHNLGYTPAVLCYLYYVNDNSYWPMPIATGLTTSGGNVAMNNYTYWSVDSSDLFITFYSGATTNWGTMQYRYYLLRETAS